MGRFFYSYAEKFGTILDYKTINTIITKLQIMKTRIIYLCLFLSLFFVLFTSCKKDNRPAELNTDTQQIVFDRNESVKYFGLTNSGNTSMEYQVSTNDDFLEVSPSSGIIGFNQVARIEVKTFTNDLDYGLHTGNIYVNSNGGTRNIEVLVFKALPNPASLWWDIDYIKIPNNSDRDYITIRNDGEEPLDYNLNSNSDWIRFSSNQGSLLASQEEVVWVIVDRTGLNNNLYTGNVIINSNGGNANVSVDMEVGVYSVSFFNPTYTVMDINVPGNGAQQIPVLDRVNYIYPSNPGNIFYTASTKGETVNSQQLGLIMQWQENINLSGENSPIFDLNIGADFFFLSAANYGIHHLDNWSINYDTEYQFDEDVNIPNDGYEYYFGYYDALENSNVYARIVGTDYDAIWENGTEFNFPWTNNQGILLESDLKSGASKSERIFNKDSGVPETLKIKPQTQKKLRVRKSQPLLNTNQR